MNQRPATTPLRTARACAAAALLMFSALAAPIADAYAAPTAAAAAPFNADSVPITRKALPEFPYIDWPDKLARKYQRSEQQDFDRAWFIAGNTLHAAEGQVSRRRFTLRDAKMSRLEVVRNYENALKELGAVRIDTAKPVDKELVAAPGINKRKVLYGELKIFSSQSRYAAYLIRTPEKRVWFGLTVSEGGAFITTLEEKQMEQSVALTKADEMKAALDKQGFIALYINFDTDKANLRDDGKPAIDEIAKLMKNHPGLRIAVEGHTDNSGDAKHNKALSEQRAATIVATLRNAGIDGARLKSAGHGADKPIADNRTEEGRARNRRVELVKI